MLSLRTDFRLPFSGVRATMIVDAVPGILSHHVADLVGPGFGPLGRCRAGLHPRKGTSPSHGTVQVSQGRKQSRPGW